MTKRTILISASLALAVVAVAGFVWFQPQKLVIDKEVNEAAPTPAASSSPTRSGIFRELTHHTEGRAIASGGIVRFESFETSNGPDVVVWLSAADEDDYADDFVDLGPLKGNKGSQNYAIPPGTDLDRYDTVVIWCRRFTVPFGAAELR